MSGDFHQPSQEPQPYHPAGDYAPLSTNSAGMTGFILSLCGLLCFPISPVGLVVSLIGLRKRPRAFAIAGTVIGAVGCVLLLLFVEYFGPLLGFCIGWGGSFDPVTETQMTIGEASDELQYYYDENSEPPSQGKADSLISGDIDAWGNPLRYEPGEDETYVIRSAGVDGEYDTADDLTHSGTYGPKALNAVDGDSAEDEPAEEEPATDEAAEGANEDAEKKE